MDEILSQEEIDMLISMVGNADEDIEQELDDQESASFEPYDFKRPSKLSKEHLRGLQRIHEQFCRKFSGYMSARLRTRVELDVLSVDQLTFGEFVSSLANPSVLVVLDAQNLNNKIVLQFSPESAFLLFDRVCGGPGYPQQRNRPLTDIELVVFKNQIVTSVCRLLTDSWQEVVDVGFSLDLIENNPQFLQVAPERDTVVLLTLSISINGNEDHLNVCIPYETIEPVLKRIGQHRLHDASFVQPDKGVVSDLKRKLMRANLAIEAVLGQTTVTVSELLDLEVGDVIVLEQQQDAPLDLVIGSSRKYRGVPGRVNDKVGVKITEVCE